MAHTDTPHPMSDVAIAIPVTDATITTAHKLTTREVEDGVWAGKPKMRYIPIASCSGQPAASLSYAYATTRGAIPCTADACWGTT